MSLEIPEIDMSGTWYIGGPNGFRGVGACCRGLDSNDTVRRRCREAAKRPSGTGPLAEVEFWRERHRALSALYEQLQLPRVQAILQTLKKSDAHAMISYTNSYGELQKLAIEAKDNTKFLSDFERHFKTLSSGSFAAILDTLPTMLNAVRMVWIISRHYNNS